MVPQARFEREEENAQPDRMFDPWGLAGEEATRRSERRVPLERSI